MKTGVFVSADSLLDKIRDFLLSCGWVIERNLDSEKGKELVVRDKLNNHFVFHSFDGFDPYDFSESTSITEGVVCGAIAAYDESRAWDDMSGYFPVLQQVLFSGPGSVYRFFDFDDYVVLTTEYEHERCAVMMLGKLPVFQESVGQFVTATSRDIYAFADVTPVFSYPAIRFIWGETNGFISPSLIGNSLDPYFIHVYDVGPGDYIRYPLDMRVYANLTEQPWYCHAELDKTFYISMEGVDPFEILVIAGEKYIVIPFGKKPEPFDRDQMSMTDGFGILIKL